MSEKKNEDIGDKVDPNKITTLSSIAQRYNGVSVSRMKISTPLQTRFVEKIKSLARGVNTYNTERASETGKVELLNRFTDSSDKTDLPTDTSSIICTDLPRLAAQQMMNEEGISTSEKNELSKLVESNMAKDMFNSFYSPYSCNL